MPYQHIEIELNQASYRNSNTCGDVFISGRTNEHTTLILCDGKGHGIKAKIAASFCSSFLHNASVLGMSVRAALDKLIAFFVQTGKGDHYSVFIVARIFNDGMVNVLNFGMPCPILISTGGAKLLSGRPIITSIGEIFETNCYIRNDEGIMLMSDGVVSAGIGRGKD